MRGKLGENGEKFGEIWKQGSIFMEFMAKQVNCFQKKKNREGPYFSPPPHPPTEFCQNIYGWLTCLNFNH